MNGNSLKPFLFSNMETELTQTTTVQYLYLERVVHSPLLDHLEKYHLLTNCQYGYRKNRSTEFASTLLLDDIRKSVDRGELVGAVFIDLSKAFDNIGHEILLSKLPSYGIRNTELTRFTDYLFSKN